MQELEDRFDKDRESDRSFSACSYIESSESGSECDSGKDEQAASNLWVCCSRICCRTRSSSDSSLSLIFQHDGWTPLFLDLRSADLRSERHRIQRSLAAGEINAS